MSKIKTPIVILNFKTYLESCGDSALNLAKALESVQEETDIKMVACPQACDIYRIKNETFIDVLSQHIDAVSPGSHTGSTLFEGVLAAGIDGSLINHSEKRLTLADIQAVNQQLLDNDLEPEIVEGTVDKVKAINKNVKVLCGAGISTGEDMQQALELGAEGVLLASGIVKADNPKDALLDLVSKI